MEDENKNSGKDRVRNKGQNREIELGTLLNNIEYGKSNLC